MQKEERAPYIEPEHVFSELLSNSRSLELKVKGIEAKHEKYLMQVSLEEPAIETEEMNELEVLTGHLVASGGFEDGKAVDPKTQTQHKQECDPLENAIVVKSDSAAERTHKEAILKR